MSGLAIRQARILVVALAVSDVEAAGQKMGEFDVGAGSGLRALELRS